MFEIRKLDPWGFAKTHALFTGIAGIIVSLPGIIYLIARIVSGRSLYFNFFNEEFYWTWTIVGSIGGGLLIGYVFALLYNLIAKHRGGIRVLFEKNQNNNYYFVKKVNALVIAKIATVFIAISSILGLVLFFLLWLYTMYSYRFNSYSISSNVSLLDWEEIIMPIVVAVISVVVGFFVFWVLGHFYNWLAKRKRGLNIVLEYLPESQSYDLIKFRVGQVAYLSGLFGALIYFIGAIASMLIRGVSLVLFSRVSSFDFFDIFDIGFILMPALGGLVVVFVLMAAYGAVFSAIYNVWSKQVRFLQIKLIKPENKS